MDGTKNVWPTFCKRSQRTQHKVTMRTGSTTSNMISANPAQHWANYATMKGQTTSVGGQLKRIEAKSRHKIANVATNLIDHGLDLWKWIYWSSSSDPWNELFAPAAFLFVSFQKELDWAKEDRLDKLQRSLICLIFLLPVFPQDLGIDLLSAQ